MWQLVANERWIIYAGFASLLLAASKVFKLAKDKWCTVKQCYMFQDNLIQWHLQLRRGLKSEEEEEYWDLIDLLQNLYMNCNQMDVVCWGKNKGDFFVKAVYCSFEGDSTPYTKFQAVWKVKTPLKVQTFTWLVFEKSIITRMYRRKWRPDCEMVRPMCENAVEDADHLMCSCPICCEVWGIFGSIFSLHLQFSDVQQMWESFKVHKLQGYARNQIVSLLPHAICWSSWRE